MEATRQLVINADVRRGLMGLHGSTYYDKSKAAAPFFPSSLKELNDDDGKHVLLHCCLSLRSLDSPKTFVHAFVEGVFDYCVALSTATNQPCPN